MALRVLKQALDRGRGALMAGLALGLVWALGVLAGAQMAGLPYLPPALSLPGAFVPPGLVAALMVARVARHRFGDADLAAGGAPAPASTAEIDRRVLVNTIEQLVLALALWPFVALTLGGAVAVVMGVSFALARLVFWVGYHRAPMLRAIGFAATFFTTVLATLWALAVWAV